MSLQELEDYKVAQKALINEARENIRAANDVYRDKFMMRYAEERYGIDVEGLSATDQKDLLRILKKQKPKEPPPGSVTVTPATAELTQEGH